MSRQWRMLAACALAAILTVNGSAVAWADEDTAASVQKENSNIDAAMSVFPDGEYDADSFDFGWNGGSGRIQITCEKLRVEDGLGYATIEFSSEHYTYVKVGGETYDEPDHSNGTSVFEIPITLNEKTEIIGQTTAMSTPHEITYTIYVGALGTLPEDMSDNTDSQDAAETADDTESSNGEAGSSEEENLPESSGDSKGSEYVAPEIDGLTYESTMDLDYAQCFSVYYYNDGYKLLDIHESGESYLLIPEGKESPENLDENITVLQQPVENIYLAATAVMSLFDSLDALDNIRLSGTDADGWYIDNAVTAMENGDILYAGKYSEPDYELLVAEDCHLAIESTMIQHSPKVKEMIEDLGIPVLTDYSSYESHPLGRTEWIKFYGALLNKEDEAEEFFESQASVMDDLEDFENTEKTVAFFYVSTDGMVVVRSSADYVPKMIEIAGGRYIFEDLYADEGQKSSVSMSMEDFYAEAIDADYLIYNATIENPITSVDELLEKSDLFADFKAVKEGNVWCCGKYLYQATDIVGTMISDFHKMLTEEDPTDMTFITRLEN